MKTFGICVLCLFCFAAVAGGLRFSSWIDARFKETRTSSVAHVPGEALKVTTTNGAVEVKKSSGEYVEITAHIKATTQERLDAVKVVAERNAEGTLEVSVVWPDGDRKGSEGCSFELLVPEATAITLQSSNGALTATGFTATLDLKTSNGAITITDHTGSAKAQSSNGRIAARNVDGKLELDTSNGSIEIVQSGLIGSSFTAETSNGSVTLELSPAFSGELSMKTSNGSIDAENLKGATIIESGRKSMRLGFGDSKNTSRVQTSNGSIRLRVLEKNEMAPAPTPAPEPKTEAEPATVG